MEQLISGRANRPTTIEVFEPSQDENFAPLVLDRFTLGVNENKLYDMPSATAGYRMLDPSPEELEEISERRRANPSAPTPAQEPRDGVVLPETQQEIEAGRARQEAVEKEEARIQKRRDAANKRSAGGSRAGKPQTGKTQAGKRTLSVAGPRAYNPALGHPYAGVGDEAEPTIASGGAIVTGTAPEEAREGERAASTPQEPDLDKPAQQPRKRGRKPGSSKKSGSKKSAEK